MNYWQTYKNFIHSHNVNEGLRMTAGIALPALIMSYFDVPATGVVLSVGALCVAVTDSPGPIHHRSNGMLVCNVLIFFIALVIGLVFNSVVILGIILFIFCFIFSMLGVYGNREGSIGIAALLVTVLNLQHPKQGWAIILNALYILAGGMWYMFFSLLLHRLRPYKAIQQLLGDYIQATADYLKERAIFYNKSAGYEEAYNEVMVKQAHVQEMQNNVNELMFKTRVIVKESTSKGRMLVMIYLDVTDIFERVMTSYQSYETLHSHFDETAIFEKIRSLLLQLANELHEIGIAVKSGMPTHENYDIAKEVKTTRQYYGKLRVNFMKPENLEGFVGMGRIVESLKDLSERINILHQHTAYKLSVKKRSVQNISYDKLIDHKAIEPRIFFDSLNLKSNIFRHSLRVSVAVMAGYLISLFFKTGHSYWILLTIIVILKPAYSLTKKRNRDRLTGTVCGVVIGVVIIFLIKNNTALLIVMLLLMAGCYIFLRTNYLVSVLLMTPYLLIFFHLLYPADFKILLTDRIIDTVLGSAIAFITSIFFIPAWEHTLIRSDMVKMLHDNSYYYKVTATGFSHKNETAFDQLHLARKNAFVSLANLSDAFTRMLSEPKRHQKEIQSVHRFVVLNHIIASHIATLSYYLQTRENVYHSPAFQPVIDDTLLNLDNAAAFLEAGSIANRAVDKQFLTTLNRETQVLMDTRKHEIEKGLLETSTKNLLIQSKSVTDQFNYIYSAAADLNKVSEGLHLG